MLSTIIQVLGKIFLAHTYYVFMQNSVLADLQNQLLCLERFVNIGQGVFPPTKVQNGNIWFKYHFKNNEFLLEWVSSSLSGAV